MRIHESIILHKRKIKIFCISLFSLAVFLPAAFVFSLWFVGLHTKPWVAAIIQDREEWFVQVKWEMNHKDEYAKLEQEAKFSSPSFSQNKGTYPSILITRRADPYKQFTSGGKL